MDREHLKKNKKTVLEHLDKEHYGAALCLIQRMFYTYDGDFTEPERHALIDMRDEIRRTIDYEMNTPLSGLKSNFDEAF